MQIRIPGRVWFDAFEWTGREDDFNLPQPQVRRKGMGRTYVYDDLTETQAVDVADYLHQRSLMQSAQNNLGPNERELYRIMERTSQRIRVAARISEPRDPHTA